MTRLMIIARSSSGIASPASCDIISKLLLLDLHRTAGAQSDPISMLLLLFLTLSISENCPDPCPEFVILRSFLIYTFYLIPIIR